MYFRIDLFLDINLYCNIRCVFLSFDQIKTLLLLLLLLLETGSKHNEGVFSLCEFEIVNWNLSSKTGLDSKELKSENSLLEICAQSFSDTLASIGRLGEEKSSVGTCDSPDNEACVLFLRPKH